MSSHTGELDDRPVMLLLSHPDAGALFWLLVELRDTGSVHAKELSDKLRAARQSVFCPLCGRPVGHALAANHDKKKRFCFRHTVLAFGKQECDERVVDWRARALRAEACIDDSIRTAVRARELNDGALAAIRTGFPHQAESTISALSDVLGSLCHPYMKNPKEE